MNYKYRTSYWWQVIIVAYENCVFGYRCIVHDWSFLNAYIFEKKNVAQYISKYLGSIITNIWFTPKYWTSEFAIAGGALFCLKTSWYS